VIIGLASSRYLSYLARESLFKNKIFAGLIKSLDAIPINHRGWSREGLQGVLDALGRNKAVLIFPEGERTYDGKLAPFKPGVALLAARSKAPIVPVGISGAYEAWPRTEKSPILNPMWCPASPRALAVSVGEPIPYSRYENMSREEMLRDLEREVQRQMDRAEALKRHAPRADAS
jgi:1-acyl-sn-glycerol-3-phosphate acyltransferase